MSSNPADAKQPSATDRLLKVATHQAQNLESLKNEGQWLHGRVESIDQMITEKLDVIAEQAKLTAGRAWHIAFWCWFWSILGILGFLISMLSTGRSL